jgi:hypothetical protein
MTAAVALDEPFSVRQFLTGDGRDTLADLAGTLAEQGGGRAASRVLRQASDSVRSAVGAEVMRAVDALLDLDLGGLLLAGWRKHRSLTAAAQQSHAAPRTSIVVSLAEHTVTSTHRPRVDLLVRDKRVASVHLQLSVRFTVRGLAATVRDGKLVALTGGAAEIGVELSVEDQELAHRTRRVDLPLVVRLGDGVPLGRSRRREVEPPTPPDPAGAPAAAGGPAARPDSTQMPAAGDYPAVDVAAAPEASGAVRPGDDASPVARPGRAAAGTAPEADAVTAPGADPVSAPGADAAPGPPASTGTGLVVHLPGRDDPLPGE